MKAGKVRDVVVLEPVVPEKASRVKGRVRMVREPVEGRAAPSPQIEVAPKVMGEPLTAAERHKRYREKHGEAYREANKLRMRKARRK